MTSLDLLRSARDLESLGHPAEADRLRWAASRAVSGSVVSSGALSEPSAVGDDDLDLVTPWCPDPSVLDLSALPVCERLAG